MPMPNSQIRELINGIRNSNLGEGGNTQIVDTLEFLIKERTQTNTQRVLQDEISGFTFRAFRIRNPENGEWSKIQIHVLYRDSLLANFTEDLVHLTYYFVESITEEQRKLPHDQI